MGWDRRRPCGGIRSRSISRSGGWARGRLPSWNLPVGRVGSGIVPVGRVGRGIVPVGGCRGRVPGGVPNVRDRRGNGL